MKERGKLLLGDGDLKVSYVSHFFWGFQQSREKENIIISGIKGKNYIAMGPGQIHRGTSHY